MNDLGQLYYITKSLQSKKFTLAGTYTNTHFQCGIYLLQYWLRLFTENRKVPRWKVRDVCLLWDGLDLKTQRLHFSTEYKVKFLSKKNIGVG